jgi:hypothetical protein
VTLIQATGSRRPEPPSSYLSISVLSNGGSVSDLSIHHLALVAPKRSEGGSLGEGGTSVLELEPVLHTGEGPWPFAAT